LLCSIIDIGNNCLEQFGFDRCHSIDLTFDYFPAAHQPLIKQFYSHVMPLIRHDIQSLTINLHHILSIKTFVENNCNGTLPNRAHLKILLCARCSKADIPYIIGNL
jgi:hypothetical protein